MAGKDLHKRNALIVCPDYPYPTNGGNKIAIHGYMCALGELGVTAIDLIAFDRVLPIEERSAFGDILTLQLPKKYCFANIVKFVFLGRSYLFLRYDSQENVNQVRQFLNGKKYDIVIVVHAYMAQSISALLHAVSDTVILSSEVLEGRALKERVSLSANVIKRAFLKIEAERAEKAEFQVLRQYKAVLFYGEEDLACYQKATGMTNGYKVNLGLDLQRYKVLGRQNSPIKVLAFYGSFSWYPNVDALKFLLDVIWPFIIQNRNDVVLRVAGRNIPNWALEYDLSSVEFMGQVESMQDFVSSADIVLSPVRIGGGARLKMLEAMAWGRPVISTSIGLEGNEAAIGLAVRVANTPEKFLDEVNNLLDNDTIWQACVSNSLDYVRREHDCRTALVSVLSQVIA